MPGWIIQGVRGEGKSLCAVGKIKEYLERGCPVATNLDLYLENLVSPDNSSLVYRLPDYPRSQDFHALPEAFDSRYKGEDRNGLIVLDESIIWLNGRNFKVPDREEILRWLILSRKMHWDLILLSQDYEAIDKTARTALCDYLVQASRSDRQKQTFWLLFFNFFKYAKLAPTVHRYDVYYGFSFANPPVDRWEFTGTELYDGYDTNQMFRDGKEVLGDKLVDMRAVYCYLPAQYLTKRFYIRPLEQALERIRSIQFKQPDLPDFSLKGGSMAVKRSARSDNTKPKIIVLSVFLVGFLAWRFFSFSSDDLPGNHSEPVPVPSHSSSDSILDNFKPVSSDNGSSAGFSSAVPSNGFIDRLLSFTRPRLAALLFNNDKGPYGLIEFYQGDQLVERFTISELHGFGVAVVRKSYGVDLVTNKTSYPVTPWPKVKNVSFSPNKI